MDRLKRNIELKARYRDLFEARKIFEKMGARHVFEQVQTDTYFQVNHGRLKLRETDGGRSELIWYNRPNDEGERTSDYYVIPVKEPAALRAALAAACGVRGQVKKLREVLILHNVRIHLDKVEGLGEFIEFEAVIDRPADEEPSRHILERLRSALGIMPGNTIAGSYADLKGLE